MKPITYQWTTQKAKGGLLLHVISLSTRVSELSRPTTAYFTFNCSRGDYEGLYEYLSWTDFTTCYLSDGVEYIWHVIEHQLTSADISHTTVYSCK